MPKIDLRFMIFLIYSSRISFEGIFFIMLLWIGFVLVELANLQHYLMICNKLQLKYCGKKYNFSYSNLICVYRPCIQKFSWSMVTLVGNYNLEGLVSRVEVLQVSLYYKWCCTYYPYNHENQVAINPQTFVKKYTTHKLPWTKLHMHKFKTLIGGYKCITKYLLVGVDIFM